MKESGYIYRIGQKLYVRYGKPQKAHLRYPIAYFNTEKECIRILERLLEMGYKRGDALSDTSLWQEDSLWEGDYSFIK